MSIKDRGFASISPDRRRAIASLGGIAAHAQGTGHEWTRAEAQAAGRKGGLAKQRRQRLLRRALDHEAALHEAELRPYTRPMLDWLRAKLEADGSRPEQLRLVENELRRRAGRAAKAPAGVSAEA